MKVKVKAEAMGALLSRARGRGAAAVLTAALCTSAWLLKLRRQRLVPRPDAGRSEAPESLLLSKLRSGDVEAEGAVVAGLEHCMLVLGAVSALLPRTRRATVDALRERAEALLDTVESDVDLASHFSACDEAALAMIAVRGPFLCSCPSLSSPCS